MKPLIIKECPKDQADWFGWRLEYSDFVPIWSLDKDVLFNIIIGKQPNILQSQMDKKGNCDIFCNDCFESMSASNQAHEMFIELREFFQRIKVRCIDLDYFELMQNIQTIIDLLDIAFDIYDDWQIEMKVNKLLFDSGLIIVPF